MFFVFGGRTMDGTPAKCCGPRTRCLFVVRVFDVIVEKIHIYLYLLAKKSWISAENGEFRCSSSRGHHSPTRSIRPRPRWKWTSPSTRRTWPVAAGSSGKPRTRRTCQYRAHYRRAIWIRAWLFGRVFKSCRRARSSSADGLARRSASCRCKLSCRRKT